MTIRSYNIPQQVTSVRLAATSNLAGSYYNGILGNGVGATLTASTNGLLTVDGINPIQSDRILLSNQNNPNEDGIYDVTSPGSSSSPWVLRRSPDYQSLEQLKLGQYFSVDAGATLAGNMFVLVEPLPSSIGSIGSAGMSFLDVTTGGSSGGGPFLRIANNLSDVQSLNKSYNNFGLGGLTSLTLTDSDFAFFGGSYQLTNPCPNIISLNCTTTSGNTLILPEANGSEAFGLYQGPYIFNIGTKRVNINNFSGVPQTPSIATSTYHFLLTDNSTVGGLWDAMGVVTDILGQTGSVSLLSGANIDISPNDNGTITISAISGPSAVSSGQANFYIINTSTATTFTGTNQPKPIAVDSLFVLYQNNFNVTKVGSTPNAQFLTNATRQCLVNAVLTLRTSSTNTQTYTIHLAVVNGASTTITHPLSWVTLSPSIAGGPQEISLTYNLALTGPGDNVQVWIANQSTITDPVVVIEGSVTILDTTQFGGFNSTDVLPQGVNNLYLSQNGGSTYQNVSGTPVVTNNLVSFNTTGGQLKDSGISSASVMFLNIVTVTSATQTMSLSTTYFNNYSGGQCVYLLPVATGSGKIIKLISLNTASTSGWRVNTNGTNKIQFGSSLSAAGGNIVSTAGSATDCADFTDAASGLWTVYPALGSNLIVT